MQEPTEPQGESASYLMLVTLALATLSTMLFLLTVLEVPGEALFVVVVALAAGRRKLRCHGVDMSLTARILTVPCARSRRRAQPARQRRLLVTREVHS